jgi:hypothetical protein
MRKHVQKCYSLLPTPQVLTERQKERNSNIIYCLSRYMTEPLLLIMYNVYVY